MPLKLNQPLPGGDTDRATPLLLIKDMISYYRQSTNLKCPATGEDDALSCWVSIKELFALITDNPGANGIRIYYGRHRDTTMGNGVPLEYKDRHNIILVPTQDNVNPTDATVVHSNDMLNADESAGAVNSVSYSGNGIDGVPPIPPASTGKSL